jgi:pimeloyl-ACP methyl ester carboxylesterase
MIAPADSLAVAGTQRGFLERPGCRIYYEVTGTGPAVLFLHGIGSSHLTWWQQVAHFSGRYTCVTVSHRGYPPSSDIPGGPDPNDFPGDLAALIDHLGLTGVVVVGQSMGGWACLEYALSHPSALRALVLTSTPGTIDRWSIDPPAFEPWEAEASILRGDMARRGIAPAAGERMAREQPALHFLYRAIANASVSETFHREDLRKRLFAMATRKPDVLSRIAVPTLFIMGGEDTTFPAWFAERLAGLTPNGRAAVVPDAGHSVYFERPAVFNRLLEDFLAAHS